MRLRLFDIYGKCVDVEVMSIMCRECDIGGIMKASNPGAYKEWKQQHEGNCTINHQGSSGANVTHLSPFCEIKQTTIHFFDQ